MRMKVPITQHVGDKREVGTFDAISVLAADSC